MSTATMTPPFKADQVGSLLRPANLLEARERRTIPSPSVLHFRGGRKAIDTNRIPTAYPDMDEFHADLARVYREEIRDLTPAAAICRSTR